MSLTSSTSRFHPPGAGTAPLASFLLGLPNYYSKDVQTETMTGREWQNALYLRDRWRVTPQPEEELSIALRTEQR